MGGRARERQQAPSGNGAPCAVGSHLEHCRCFPSNAVETRCSPRVVRWGLVLWQHSPLEGPSLCRPPGQGAAAEQVVVAPQPAESSGARRIPQAPGLPWDVFAIFPRHCPMSANRGKKQKLRHGQTKPMVCAKQRGSPWDFPAAWSRRAVPVQDGHLALPGHGAGAGGLRVGLVKAGPSCFFSAGRSEVYLSSCTSPLATACLGGRSAQLRSGWQALADSEVTRAGESLSRAEDSSSSTTVFYQPAERQARD